MGKRTDSRDRTVAAAERLFRARGVSGTGLREIVETAGTARGALGHHFPDGKPELAIAVVHRNASRVATLLRAAVDADPRPSPADTVRAVTGVWRQELHRTDYTLGCPLVAMVVDNTVDRPDVRAAVTEALTSWETPLSVLLGDDGLAIALLSAVEGAVILSRARHDTRPLDEVERAFITLVPVHAG